MHLLGVVFSWRCESFSVPVSIEGSQSFVGFVLVGVDLDSNNFVGFFSEPNDNSYQVNPCKET